MSKAEPRHNRLREYAQRHGVELYRGMLVTVAGVDFRLCGLSPGGEKLALKRPQGRTARTWVTLDDPRVVLVPTDIAPRQPRRPPTPEQERRGTEARQTRAKARHLAWLRGRMPSEAMQDWERDFSAAPIARRYGEPR